MNTFRKNNTLYSISMIVMCYLSCNLLCHILCAIVLLLCSHVWPWGCELACWHSSSYLVLGGPLSFTGETQGGWFLSRDVRMWNFVISKLQYSVLLLNVFLFVGQRFSHMMRLWKKWLKNSEWMTHLKFGLHPIIVIHNNLSLNQ
jgi:hypothetical protein